MELGDKPGFVPDPWYGKRMASRRRSLPKGFDADAWRVRREFSRDPRGLPPPPFKDGEIVGAAAMRVVRSLGLPGEDASAALVEKIWREAAGPDVAEHARPGELQGGTLAVKVRGSAWLAELRREGPAGLMPRLRAACARLGAPCPVRALKIVPDFG